MPDMDIGQWIKASRTAAGMGQEQLGSALGVTRGNVSAWENNRHEPSLGQVMQIRSVTKSAIPLPGLPDGVAPIQNFIAASIGSRRVPLISSVQAGRMTEAIDPFPPGGAFEYLLTDLELSESAFALEIEGDSMTPDFNPGDRVIVDPAVHPRPGDFVVAKNGREEATFKKYRARGIGADGREAFELVPLNPDYPAISSDHEPVRIIGVMVEHRRYRKR
ncbi:helix-turn-helix domain-containing protein [Burkholderia sp. Bp8995]|nr:helix-turn-helix domain-containing protein [Burkholderia sp. Bp8995]